MNMEKDGKIAIVIAALIIGVAAGYFFGAQSGKKAVAEERKKASELQKSLDVFVPPLPATVTTIGGKIITVKGDSFIIEIPSLTDRYPKPGAPMKTETKTIRVTDKTKITDTNFNPKNFKNGVPQQKIISAKDLKIGDTVSITVSGNARTEQNLTATNISRSSGI